MVRFALLAVALVLVAGTSNIRGQDFDEVKRLKKEIELLQAKLEAANLKIEKLEAQLKATQSPKNSQKEGAKKALSDYITVGAVLRGDYRSTNKGGGKGEMTLTITDRDGKKFKGTVAMKYQGKVLPDANVEGEIDGIRMTYNSVGNSDKIITSMIMKGGGLEGSWTNSSSSGGKGQVAFILPKLDD